MKQLKLLFTVLFLAVLGLGNVWAETATLILDKLGASLTSTSNTTMSTTSITATGTEDDYTLNYLQGKKQGDAILLAKSTGAFIANATAMPGDIKSVTVYINSGASGKTTYHCAFSSTACTEAETTGSTAVNITGGNSNKYTCSTTGCKYFCVSLGNANNGQVLKLEVEYEKGGSTETAVNVTGVSLDKTSLTLAEGATETLIATIAPDDATNKNVNWESNNESVATVANGVVTAKSAGSAIITVKSAADATKTATCNVTVNAFTPTAGEYEIALNNVFFNCDAFTSKPKDFTSATGTDKGISIKYIAASNAYINATQCRIYAGTKLDFTAPSGFELTSIVLGTTTESPSISADAGSFSGKTWTGNATSVTLTGTQSTGNYQVTSVTVTYAEKVASSVATPELSVAAGTYEGTKNVKVSNYDAALSYFYTLDGNAPTNESAAYNHTTGIDVAASATLKVIAYDASSNASEVASAAYVIIPVYASLAELVAAGAPTATGWKVKVTLTDEEINDFPNTKGVNLVSGSQIVQIYCNAVTRPADWKEHGTVSGTLTCDWKLFGTSTWELCPTSWADLSYTAPTEEIIVPEYASLSELVVGGAPTAATKAVKVTFTNDVITRITDDRKGIFFMVGEQEVEVYCSSTTCPTDWTVNGQVSGIFVEGEWVLYTPRNGEPIWEIKVADWTAFGYTAYVSHVTGVTFANGSVFAGKTLDLATLVEIAPADASNKNVSFEIVSGSEFISLSEGVVTGVAEGSAVVRVTTEDGSFTADATITVEAVSVWATTYTSNVTLSTTGGTNATASKVKVNNEEDEYDAIKAGTSKADGIIKVTLPLGTTKLHFHAVTWSGSAATATLSVKKNGDGTELFGNVIRPNTGLSGSSTTYTLAEDPTDDYYSIDFGSALTEATTVVFDASVNRFAIYGVNVEKEEIELVSITISGTATKTEYFAGDVFDPAGLVVTGTYSVGEPQEITEGIDWTFTPATLAVGTTSVSVVATVGEKSSEAFVVNDLTVAAADTRKTATNEDVFAATSGSLNSDIKYAAYQGAASTAPFITTASGKEGRIRLYQNGGYITLSAVKGCKIDEVIIVTSDEYASTTVGYSINNAELATEGNAVASSSEWKTAKGLNAEKVNVVCLGTDKNTRLEIATITVKYTGEPEAPTSIVLTTTDVQTEFEVGETFNSENLVVEAVYSDESKEDVTEKAEVVAPSMETPGEKTVTVNYLTFSETYNITVVAATPVISVDKETIAFGNVNLNSEVEAKTVAVTLENLAAATAAISGEGAAKFAIDVTELTASGNITISVVTNEEGEYAATLTISGEGAESKTVALSMTVVNIAEIKQEDVTPAEIYASALTDVDLTATPFEGSALTITYSKGTNTSNKPGFFVSDKTIRTYVNNTITISSTTKNIYMVEISYKSEANADKGMGIFANNNHGYVVCDGVSSVELTATGTSRITNITVYYENKKEEVRGGLNVGMFGTICVEKMTLAPAGAHFYTLNQYDAANSTLSVTENTTGRLEAGVPYIFQAEGAEIGGIVVANSEEASDNNGLYAVLDEAGYTVSGSETGIYGIVGNEVRPAANGARFPKGRCYIKLGEVSPIATGAPARAFRVVAGPNTATGFELIEISADAKKVLINNHVYIQRDGKIYDIIGHIVK